MHHLFESVKAGYFAAVRWIDNNPHTTLWLAAAALGAVLVLA
jgi:hypothetical protein